MILRNEWVLSANSIAPATKLYQEIFDFLDDRQWGYFELHHAFDADDEIAYPEIYSIMLVEGFESLLLLC